MILIDVHPARATLPDGQQLEQARVVLTHRRMRVWSLDGGVPQLVHDEPAVNATFETQHPLIGRPFDVAGVTIERMRGCGCGSPLKVLQPPRDDE